VPPPLPVHTAWHITASTLAAEQPPPNHPAWDKRKWVVFSDLHVQEKSLDACLQVWVYACACT
jgi:hypothetical protein